MGYYKVRYILGFSFIFIINLFANDDILKTIDNFRLPFENAIITTNFSYKENNKEIDNIDYKVYIDSQDNSLVLFLTSIVKGQRVLMINQGLWFYSPSSQKAIKISQLQRAMGRYC